MTSEHLTPTLTALNREWAALVADAAPLPASWRLACPTLGPGATLADVLPAIRREPDAVLLGLLSLHRTGEHLAGRAVVQAMLGKMVLMASRDPVASLDDHLAALWVRIATYPVGRRRRRVAANLALDTLKALRRADRAPQGSLEVLPPDPLGDAARVLDAAARLGLIDDLTRRTLRTVYVAGHTSRDAAEALGMTPDTVRWRCSRGVRALRAAAPALVDALAA